ncbi:MAG TPA: L,D-transpeptidase family protein [Mucilaginibacter sp.]
MADELFKITKNKIFKNADPEVYAEVFKKELKSQKANLNNEAIIEDYYSKEDYQPKLVLEHSDNGDLDAIPGYFEKVGEHGLDSGMFSPGRLRALLSQFHNKKAFKTIDEAYLALARLELASANSLIRYSNALQFGVLNPKSIFSRYFTATKRPDSTSMRAVFKAENLKTYLDSIQPKDPQYVALQKALAGKVELPGITAEEFRRCILVNLERLRWRNKPYEPKYVYVNIPDYRLDVFENGKSVLNMKVCVGQGRNMDNAETLTNYGDTAKVDKPFPRETPQLSSLIHSVQVNPVWNIPRSIATKEIIVEATNDRYYLSNKNIDVFKDGEKIEDPEDIDWSTVDKNNNEYEFKQRPGDENSLGKIKFLFKNKSSVYLHDTPAKNAFGQAMRAVSHGCVRVGDPQGLAKNLFGEGETYDTIVKDMEEPADEPTDIALPKKTPVYITYVTCWADDAGVLQYRKDVYGLDIVVYAHLQNLGVK